MGGVSGLALQLLPRGGRTWILRTTIGEKRRDIGLGGYPSVTLAAARDRARETKDLIRQGIDPVERRKEAKAQLIASQRRGLTFSKAVDQFLELKASENGNQKHKDQWARTLTAYAKPELGRMLVDDITPQDVVRVLQPIWIEKTETASRLRGRIEAVLSWATISGHRTGDNPARWAGNLKGLLPAPKKVAKSSNWPAVATHEVASWFNALRSRPGTAARALEFLTLCASRSGEVRLATWAEMDLDKGIWFIPGERMKNGRDHRVAMPEIAMTILKELPRLEETAAVFPAPRGGFLSDMAISAVMRRMHQAELDAGRKGWLDPRNQRPAVPHGLRSTFRDWAAENGFPREMAEIALAHNVGSEVERAYRRSDLLDRRRTMMAAWSKFLSAHLTDNVVKLTVEGHA